MIEKISNQLATVVGNSLHFDEDNKEVLAYGAFVIIQTIWSLSLIIIFGIIFNVLVEACVISLVGATLRKYSGGVHATAPNRCAIIGAIMSVGLALLLSVFKINLIITLSIVFTAVSFFFTYYCILKFCPVDTPNKPIVKIETRARLKKASINLVHIFLFSTIIFYVLYFVGNKYFLLSIATAMAGGLFNQSVSLTPVGHVIINNIDKLLSHYSTK